MGGLADLDALWDEVGEPETKEREEFSGRMEATIESATLEKSKAGNDMVVYVLKVDDGKFIGRKLWKRQNMVSKNNLFFLKKDLALLGVKAKPSELADALPDIVGAKVAITVKARDGNQDIYFDRLIDSGPF